MNTIQQLKSGFIRQMIPLLIVISGAAFLFVECTTPRQKSIPTILVKTNDTVTAGYIGNGAQWDPFPQAYSSWNLPISEADWNKLYQRLDFMKPSFIRCMISGDHRYNNKGKYDSEFHLEPLSHILSYCNRNNITVMFGDWGGGLVDSKKNTINKNELALAARYLDFLVNEKGFSCIKYFNLVNEPNGYWSSTDGKYPLWKNAVEYFYREMKKYNLTDKVQVIGPDIAIWTTKETWWIDSCKTDLKDIIGLYDIHTYPSKSTVNSGDYSNIIRAYKEQVPVGKKIVLGELGFKYITEQDSLLRKENIQRAKNKPYASVDDSNMFVYDFFYGIDMADATMQLVNNGYAGMIAWMLDDAMHSKEGPYKLKVWGFWNILGDEFFGSQEENMRPWYYSWSIISRYMQTDANVMRVDLPATEGINAIAVEKDGHYMIALLNKSHEAHQVKLQFDNGMVLKNARIYIYADKTRPVDKNGFPVPVSQNQTIDTGKAYSVSIGPEELRVITDFPY